MYVFLLPLGVLCAVAGLVAIGFGAPIKEFALGNTLIIAGTIGAVGGLIVIGLAAAVRHLKTISAALVAPSGQRPASVRAETGEMPTPAKERPQPQQRSAAMPRRAPSETAPDPRAQRMLPPEPSPSRARPASPPPQYVPEPLHHDAPEAHSETPPMPLSPAQLRELLEGASATPAVRPQGRDEAMDESRHDHEQRSPRPPVQPAAQDDARPAPERKREVAPNPFDAVWPAEQNERSPQHVGARAEPPAGDKGKRQPANAPRAPEPRPVSILKSGVIDGMAYTLYTDGSIEAQLPQGTMRFASIDELRVYLEKSA